ncbi:hypothetical protein ACJ41O_013068 [Fusarium nematophilum]
MAADDSYTAADERARAARRAGLQAKKDEQPANTARSYAAKQREWKAPDGSLYSWPDGELVTPDKLAAWLKEDILLRRVAPPQKKPRARGRGKGKGKAVQLRQQLEQEQLEAAALAEAESLAEALEVPLAEAAELLADDREGYVPPTALAPAAEDLTEGSLLTRGTIDAYIAAVIELWRLQVAHGNGNTENPPGAPPYEASLSNGAGSGGSTTAPPLKTAEPTGSRPAIPPMNGSGSRISFSAGPRIRRKISVRESTSSSATTTSYEGRTAVRWSLQTYPYSTIRLRKARPPVAASSAFYETAS